MAKANKDYNNNNQSDVIAGAKSVYSDVRSELSSEYPEIKNIRQDLSTLKDDVVSLTRHVKSNGSKHVDDVKHFANEQVDKARKASMDVVHKLENRAAEKPGQTIALAFFAGLAASFLLGRRK